MEISSQHSFLEYWKQAIRITGHVAVLANEDQVDRAFDKSQLRLKGFDELSSLIPKKNEPDRKLLALMISIFNPDWGSQICETYRIDISTSMELNAEYTLIYLGLLTTYNGF